MPKSSELNETDVKTRALTTMTVFFTFLGVAITGTLRFLDDTPLIATLHMTFAFTFVAIIFFHVSNNWHQLCGYLKKDKRELVVALLFLVIIGLLGYGIHYFSIGSEVV